MPDLASEKGNVEGRLRAEFWRWSFGIKNLCKSESTARLECVRMTTEILEKFDRGVQICLETSLQTSFVPNTIVACFDIY